MKDNIILGVDPGTNVMGYGIIKCKGDVMDLLSMGVIELDKVKDQHLKLRRIFEKISWLIKQYKPQALAIEAPFYSKNAQSMLKLGRAQAAAMIAAATNDLEVTEYAPMKIKLAITGNGHANKEQLVGMLKQMVKGFDGDQKYLDSSDGLAAAVCHYYQGTKHKTEGKDYKGWSEFINANPDRLK